MDKIKTREIVRDIKLLDRSSNGVAHMKDAFVRTKEAVKEESNTEHNSGAEYATEKVSTGTETAVQNVSDGAVRASDYAVQRVKSAYISSKNNEVRQHENMRYETNTASHQHDTRIVKTAKNNLYKVSVKRPREFQKRNTRGRDS